MASSLLHSYRLRNGKSFVSLLAKRRYRSSLGGRAEPLQDEVVFRTAPEFRRVEQDQGEHDFVLEQDSDLFSCAKPLTDVLVRGHAQSRRGAVTTLDTGVEVGRARKTVRVHGDRRVAVGAAQQVAFGEPAPFDRMPLVWDRAYGGRDVHAEVKLHAALTGFSRGRTLTDEGEERDALAYPRNAVGRGFALAIDTERVDGTLAPNLEDPEDPVTPARLLAKDVDDWIDLPTAASYGPIHYTTFPRAAFFVPPVWSAPTRPVRELALGGVLQADLDEADERIRKPDTRVANCAPAGLAVCRLTGGERVKMWHLHPRHELLEFDLPGDPPRLYIEFPNVGSRELATPLLQTVELEPDADALTLTWVAHAEVAAPFPDDLLERIRHGVAWERSLAR